MNPYFLRLTFPHRLVEDDHSSAQYDPSSAYLTIVLTKEVPGEHFEDLDLLARLLAPSSSDARPGTSAFDIRDRPAERVEDTLQSLSLDSTDGNAKLGQPSASGLSAGGPSRPLIEVISTNNADNESSDSDDSSSESGDSFTPNEELLAERAVFLEGSSTIF